MLIISNNGNWEKSERTSTIAPEAHIDGGTVFLPVNTTEITMSVPDEVSEDGEVLSYKDAVGYAFDEYRINHPVGLPQEAMDAYQQALVLFTDALKTLGVM